MERKLFCLLMAMNAVNTNAQINLVYDFCHASASGPFYLTPFNGKLYMGVDDCINGKELYVYDGVSNPTLAYNINPGSADGLYEYNNQKMAVLGTKLYMPGNNGSSGYELFSYDGSAAPVLEQDINTGTGNSFPGSLLTFGSKIFFTAYAPTTGAELYSYDGSSLTLFDIFPGPTSSAPENFCVFRNKLLFAAADNTHGKELYSYDPATNAYSLVSDINPGTGNSYPGSFTVCNNKLYFMADDGTHGQELCVYDGTTVTRLTDLSPASAPGVSSVTLYNGTIYFSGSTNGSSFQLYRYDTATNTTALIYNIYPGGNANPSLFTEYAGKLYFTATDGSHGNELWVYDGTNTSLVTDLYPGTTSSGISELTVWNNRLYMNATNGTTGLALFAFEDKTGVATISPVSEVKVYPVPASGNCTLELGLSSAQSISISLTDVPGKTIYSILMQHFPSGMSSVQLPMMNDAPGLYFYHMYDDEGRLLYAGKIVKE